MAKRPNIVWLLTDHQIFSHHITRPGPRPVIPTFERLATEGVAFSQAYAVCPLCTPARASMLTGVYPHRHEMVANNGELGSRLDFEPDQRLFSHYLREAGYRVGYFGKWHTGDRRGIQDYGFEGWSVLGYGYPYCTDKYREYLEELSLPVPSVRLEWTMREADFSFKSVDLTQRSGIGHLMGSCGVLTSPIETHEAFFVTHLANKWLEQVARHSDPFCLRVDVWGPHHPYYVAEPFAGSVDAAAIPEYPNYAVDLEARPAHHREFLQGFDDDRLPGSWDEWRPILARCYEHATLVDAALGRVLDTLDRLDLADDTLVIYTTDHGDIIGSNGGGWDKGWLMVEETMRIPLALRWPGRIPPGGVSDALVTNMDLVPTVLDAAGAHTPEPTDGRSLLGLAKMPERTPWPDDLMCEHHGHYGRHCFQRMLRWGPYKYVAHLGDRHELYDLERDPFELRNCIDEPGMTSVSNEMRVRLRCWMDTFDDDAPQATQLRREMGRG
ncbi:MAG: sulfatase-like hydrolase/transferase [Nitrospiraceae bacterium]|nr:sulfatase-like hydrolase/transferase [Nitrospiraceae bacterium]